jgi:hypothetical protein
MLDVFGFEVLLVGCVLRTKCKLKENPTGAIFAAVRFAHPTRFCQMLKLRRTSHRNITTGDAGANGFGVVRVNV